MNAGHMKDPIFPKPCELNLAPASNDTRNSAKWHSVSLIHIRYLCLFRFISLFMSVPFVAGLLGPSDIDKVCKKVCEQ